MPASRVHTQRRAMARHRQFLQSMTKPWLWLSAALLGASAAALLGALLPGEPRLTEEERDNFAKILLAQEKCHGITMITSIV